MSRVWLLLVAGALAGGSAIAADMPGSWTPPALPPSAPGLGSASSWYVRGDLGYGWFRVDRAVSAPGFPNPSVNALDRAAVIGGGIGYKGSWLRTDVTLDYSATAYRGSIFAPGDATAKVGALTTLFNGYLDLGTWYGLTPYIGAGAGASQIKTTDYISSAAPPFTPGLSNTQWKFAWALMAGTAYSFTPSFAMDLGYRYLNLGDVSTQSDALGAMTLKNLAAHEVRVGVRWSFDDAPLR
jgi:opacity protein-like surface antigen